MGDIQMNERFIETSHIPLTYVKKEGTKGSFYQSNGKKGILPERISLGIFAQRKDSQKDKVKKDEVNGTYKKAEEGIYKHLNNGRIHSSIWGFEDYPDFYGYGIVDERYAIYDLLILSSGNNCTSSFDVHIFRGMGKPDYIQKAFNYLRYHLKQKPL